MEVTRPLRLGIDRFRTDATAALSLTERGLAVLVSCSH